MRVHGCSRVVCGSLMGGGVTPPLPLPPGVFYPVGGKKLLTFMDDLNMPAKDTFGSQPPLELIRQWLDYGFWYDRAKQTTKHVKVRTHSRTHTHAQTHRHSLSYSIRQFHVQVHHIQTPETNLAK